MHAEAETKYFRVPVRVETALCLCCSSYAKCRTPTDAEVVPPRFVQFTLQTSAVHTA